MEGKVKELFEKVKQMFSDFNAPAIPAAPAAPAPVQLMDAQLIDGTPVKVTDMAAGGIVTINDMPAPVGDYELVDGTKIKVGDNGVIMEIMPGAAPAAPAPPVEMSAEEKFAAFETSTNEKFSQYESRFSQYEQKFTEYEAKLGKATQVIDGLFELVGKIAESPAGVPDPSVRKDNKFIEQKEEKSIIEKATLLFS